LPWLVLGDFTETLCGYEHFLNTPQPEQQMEVFRNALAACNLHDIGFSGLPYTWDNGRSGNANVRVCLDRVVVDPAWRDAFDDAKVRHLVSSRSDHCPILVELRREEWEGREQRVFRYEIMWERVDSLLEEIKKMWCSTADKENLGGLASVLRNMQQAMRRWSREHFGAVIAKLNILRRELEEIKSRTAVNRADIHVVTDRMDELMFHEEMMRLQRSRISWLKEGDRNTGYFHRRAQWRARKNKIKRLKRHYGSFTEAPNEMKGLAVCFFEDLYGLDREVRPDLIMNQVEVKVTQEMNIELCKNFTTKEIVDAMFQMGPMKVPGPNGFLARFYQRHWDIVRDDVVAAATKFFEDGIMPEGINDMAIVLIPKGNDPRELTDFRLISLCNVIYKLISKCIVNQLRGILDEIICPEQSDFAPTERINDTALVSFECTHAIQRSNGRRGDYCAYKLDLSKAYDRVD
jgi:hypothetical protein